MMIVTTDTVDTIAALVNTTVVSNLKLNRTTRGIVGWFEQISNIGVCAAKIPHGEESEKAPGSRQKERPPSSQL